MSAAIMIRVRVRGTNDYLLVDTNKIERHAPCTMNEGTLLYFRDERDYLKFVVIAERDNEFSERLAEVRGELFEVPL